MRIAVRSFAQLYRLAARKFAGRQKINRQRGNMEGSLGATHASAPYMAGARAARARHPFTARGNTWQFCTATASTKAVRPACAD